jgi:hypothetical protein
MLASGVKDVLAIVGARSFAYHPVLMRFRALTTKRSCSPQ